MIYHSPLYFFLSDFQLIISILTGFNFLLPSTRIFLVILLTKHLILKPLHFQPPFFQLAFSFIWLIFVFLWVQDQVKYFFLFTFLFVPLVFFFLFALKVTFLIFIIQVYSLLENLALSCIITAIAYIFLISTQIFLSFFVLFFSHATSGSSAYAAFEFFKSIWFFFWNFYPIVFHSLIDL